MLDALIRFSLRYRLAVLAFAVGLMIYGLFITTRLSVDVFPDLNRPTVTVLTEAHGLAPEEVETLVTRSVESILNGTPGIMRLRSSSGIGISIVHAEFDWGTETFKNRQLVAERLQLLQGKLPSEMTPVMGPVTSIMGEIQFVGLTSPDNTIDPMELRRLADWVVRPRLMTIPGISQIVVMGGEVKQFQILVSSQKLQQKGIGLEELKHALSELSENTTGGFSDIGDKEFLIRPLGRIESLEEIQNAPVGMHLGRPVYVKDIAQVRIGAKIKRGEASINAKHAVVMTVQKQPQADTISLTKAIDQTLIELQKVLPQGARLEGDLFKQARFIDSAIHNVEVALRDGAIIVAIVLFLFLANIRTTGITLVTIPLSLLMSAIVFKWLGLSINTMTLGGLAVAIGELVDDAIVDVENVFRRLRENRSLGSPKGSLRVIFEASSEVRNSIIFSTLIVILVFLPLFFLSGIEGRLFAPLGIAYIISLTASLIISLTVTPALCSYLLPKAKLLEAKESALSRWLKSSQKKLLTHTLRHPYLVLGGSGVLLVAALSLLPFMGRNFLPPFNEGTATIGIGAAPGISLAASDELGMQIEKTMLSIPEVKSTIRRTGRAEMDEHAEGVHWSEIDVDFKEGGRDRTLVLNELREKVEKVGDVYVNIGQPISHRLDHLLSGVRAQIALKIFGSDLSELRRLGLESERLLKTIPGIVDLNVEPLVQIPQLKIAMDQEEAGKYGIRTGTLAEELEIALNGTEVAQIIDKQTLFDVFMRLDDPSRASVPAIGSILVKTLPTGHSVRVSDIAHVYEGTGPNMVNRENLQRRLVVSANSSGRDLGSLVEEIKRKIQTELKLPSGYFTLLGGQFESQEQASKLLLIFGLLALLAIIGLLYLHFHSWMMAFQVLVNIPLALIGSIIAIFLTERELSVSTLIAFITLCGIASRNGIMMISHYLHLVKEEGMEFGEEMVIKGSLERLIPVLMTALSAAVALIPLLLSKGEPGKEILYPVAVVIVGGLFSSTLLDIFVTPAVFLKFGRKATEKYLAAQNNNQTEGDWK
jgi:CzcA family heavy metal efflux pump